MAEEILPGTYISVRDEGLITAGRIATGIIGIVGTAARGPVEDVVQLGTYTEARAVFGEPPGRPEVSVRDAHEMCPGHVADDRPGHASMATIACRPQGSPRNSAA